MKKKSLRTLGIAFLSATLAFSTPIMAFADSTSDNEITTTAEETTTQTVTEETTEESSKINFEDGYTFYTRTAEEIREYHVSFYEDGKYSVVYPIGGLFDDEFFEREMVWSQGEFASKEELFEYFKNEYASKEELYEAWFVKEYDGEYWYFGKNGDGQGTYSITDDEITITDDWTKETIVLTMTPDDAAVVKSITGDWGFKFEVGMKLYIEDEQLKYVWYSEDEDTDEDTETGADTYTVDLSSGDTVISSEDFNALLEENKTKDVVIKSDDDVTFTFAKGTMTAVDGMEGYDFGTTLSHTYTTDLPSYITKDNFVFKIDYNYSGKLPAKASIRIYAGTQYAGKTLYYGMLNDNELGEVQRVVVDSEGYVTVKQDHCSNYLLTSEDVTASDNDTADDGTGDNNTTDNNTAPNTGDSSMIWLYLLMTVSSLGIMAVSTTKAKALKSR